MGFLKVLSKLFRVSLVKISPKLADWVGQTLTKVLDWSERHFSGILKSTLGIAGGAGTLALVGNTANSIYIQGKEEFGLFARIFQIDDLLAYLSQTFDPQISSFCDTTLLNIFINFGFCEAVNNILNAIAYGFMCMLIMWSLKMVLGLLPAIVGLFTRI